MKQFGHVNTDTLKVVYFSIIALINYYNISKHLHIIHWFRDVPRMSKKRTRLKREDSVALQSTTEQESRQGWNTLSNTQACTTAQEWYMYTHKFTSTYLDIWYF